MIELHVFHNGPQHIDKLAHLSSGLDQLIMTTGQNIEQRVFNTTERSIMDPLRGQYLDKVPEPRVVGFAFVEKNASGKYKILYQSMDFPSFSPFHADYEPMMAKAYFKLLTEGAKESGLFGSGSADVAGVSWWWIGGGLLALVLLILFLFKFKVISN